MSPKSFDFQILFDTTITLNLKIKKEPSLKSKVVISDAANGRAGLALAHPEFGSSVNPIATRGADYAHHITARPPGFEIPAASLFTYIRFLSHPFFDNEQLPL